MMAAVVFLSMPVEIAFNLLTYIRTFLYEFYLQSGQNGQSGHSTTIAASIRLDCYNYSDSDYDHHHDNVLVLI